MTFQPCQRHLTVYIELVGLAKTALVDDDDDDDDVTEPRSTRNGYKHHTIEKGMEISNSNDI
ncbi:UNVERIFIED_CONTAM: hypothetical protein FKN15_015682 [Acipenser sinensis]